MTTKFLSISLHDALPIYVDNDNFRAGEEITVDLIEKGHQKIAFIGGSKDLFVTRDREAGYKSAMEAAGLDRSEEHTSELQSRGHLVCRLLLEKKQTATYI